jgi:general secretion pathway protein H
VAGARDQRGFTLLELLVVMTVIALITTLAVPAIQRSLPGAKFRAIASEIRSELQQARNSAIRENRDTWVLLDADAGTYRRDTGPVGRLPEGAALSFVTARRELIDEQAGRIRFFPDGTSTGGSVSIALDGRTRTIEIDWFDGRITTDATPAR